MTSIVRIVRMTFSEETISEFEAVFLEYEVDISSQPGCMSLELVKDVNNPLVRATVSRWDNEESLNNYRKSELFGVVWPKTKKLFSSPPEAVSYISKL
ncbi:MAG: antibiotic biosynthesis monooxygenase [Bacteroidetes bacterium]|nr:MAG: antibiotic biosynthesis monooxygenase [Bacteroidota bacterium]